MTGMSRPAKDVLMRRMSSITVLFIVAILALAGCGGEQDEEPAYSPVPAEPTSTAPSTLSNGYGGSIAYPHARTGP